VTMVGRAVRPLAPVGLKARRQADGALLMQWTRRSRLGAGWNDWVDVPPDEAEERYAVILAPSGAPTLETVCAEPMLLIEAAVVNGWLAAGGAGSSVAASIRQIGAHGPSPALTGAVLL